MIPEIRQRYNSLFHEDAYAAYIHDLNHDLKYPADFRVCETPLFVSAALRDTLIEAAGEIIAELRAPNYSARADTAIPPGCYVPNEDAHPNMLQIDFAICRDDSGAYTPRLIELQGFPSLFCFQAFLDQVTRRHLWIPDGFSAYFNGLTYETYRDHLRAVILDGHAPENVILMEIDPANQKTRIDFAATQMMLGIPAVDIRDVIKRGSKLFYKSENGIETPIHRIYSRFIREDPQFEALGSNLWLGEDVDVTWITHPNWFYKVSKYSLPLIRSRYASPAYFLRDLNEYPPNLENYVLKPLFLFSGAGVEIGVTADRLDRITQRNRYLLQQRVEYAPLIETPDGWARVEVRLLFTWAGAEPKLVCNLVRMSKGRMMGVRFNSNNRWVGSSVGYFAVGG